MKKTKKLSLLFAGASIIMALPSAAFAEAPPATPPGSTLEQRVEQRKAERAITLEDKDVKRLAGTCTNAQSKLRTLQNSTTSAIDKRTKTYNQIDARLLVLIGKLKLAQKDTFEFEKQREGLRQQIDAFTETGQGYKQSLDDAALVNCKVDPTAFKAMVETAKLYQEDVRVQSTELRQTIVDDIKPTITGFANELKAGN